MTNKTLSDEIHIVSEETIDETGLNRDELEWIYTKDIKKHLQEFKEEFLWKSNRECVQCKEYPTTISLFEYLMEKHFGDKLI